MKNPTFLVQCILFLVLFQANAFGGDLVENQIVDSSEYADYCAKQNCFNSSDGPIHYRDEGKGEVLVFVHGVPTSGWLFRKMILDFTEQGFRVIVPDMLGFGTSAAPAGQAIYEPKQHAKRLLELLNALAVDKCTFITHDAGSLWIAEILQNQPEMATRLILINPLMNAAGLTHSSIPSQGLFNAKTFSFLEKWNKAAFSKKIMKKGSRWNGIEELAFNGYKSSLSADRMSGLIAHYDYLGSADFQNFKYPIVQHTVLLLSGLESTITDLEAQVEVLNWPPASSLIQQKMMEGGDLLPEEFPELVAKYLMDFIGAR